MIKYFSDNFNHSEGTMSIDVWNGFVALYNEMVSNNNFAKFYPLNCPDGGIYGTNDKLLERAIKSEIPNINIPIQIEIEKKSHASWDTTPNKDDGLKLFPILDLIEFLYRHLCTPNEVGKLHDYFNHFHLNFNKNIEEIQEYFRDKVNIIFHRNSMPYLLNENGEIIRTVDDTSSKLIDKEIFYTSDSQLNTLLHTAFKKFKSPKTEDRREALDTLWDAFEQMKTHYGANGNVKESINKIIDSITYDREIIKEYIHADAKELYSIGNKTDIRHKNTEVEAIQYSLHVDYLFFRMSNLIHLLLQHFRPENNGED